MKASWYAEALCGALDGKSENDGKKILSRFREVLHSRGHSVLLRLIPNELEKIMKKKKMQNQATFITADMGSHTKWMHAYDHYEKEGVILKGTTRVDLIDESIVGGFQIRTKDIFIDGSYKKPLIELYRKITN